jgi:hypothetical protein
MKLIKALYIDVVVQKTFNVYLSFTWHNLQYFLKGDSITLACLGEEAEYMLYLNRQNFGRKKVGFFRMSEISEELYQGNALLFSIDNDFDKALVFKDVSSEIKSLSKSITFFRTDEVTEAHKMAKIK